MKKKLLLFLIATLSFAESIELQKLKVNALGKYENDIFIEKESYMKSIPSQKQIITQQALQVAGTNGDPIKALKSFAGVVSTNNDDSSEIYIYGLKTMPISSQKLSLFFGQL